MGDRQEDSPHRGFANKLQDDELSSRSNHPSLSDCKSRNSIFCAGIDEAGPGQQLAVPIRAAGRFLGQLTVENDGVSAFSRDQLSTLERVASIIALEFNKFSILRHAQQTSRYMHAIISAAQDQAILATDTHGYVIAASDGVQSVFQLSPKIILSSDVLALFTDVQLQRDLALYISNRETRILKRSKVPQAAGLTSFLDITFQSIPGAEKAPIGYLAIIRDATQSVLLYERLEALSITDELTGLCNQRHFFASLESEIERSLRYNRKFSLCFLDLDGLKLINDTQGHLRGDLILKETASLLKTRIRAHVDTCYRYGGDEFTIIMPETHAPMAQLACERIRRHLEEHFCGKPTASIGIAEWASSMKARDLIEAADRAMYNAKACGGNSIMLAPNMDCYGVRRRLEIIGNLIRP
jgi:diguanylate cyclase (GGDEF)-like protein